MAPESDQVLYSEHPDHKDGYEQVWNRGCSDCWDSSRLQPTSIEQAHKVPTVARKSAYDRSPNIIVHYSAHNLDVRP